MIGNRQKAQHPTASPAPPRSPQAAVDALIRAAKGAVMGIANTIPGVSGGTIAVVLRIYDRLISAISSFFAGGWNRNLRFLLPIVIGTGIGIVAAARVLDAVIERYPVQTAFFFVGLIIGSLPLLIRIALRPPLPGQRAFGVSHLIPLASGLGLILAMAFAGRPPLAEPITTLTLAAAPWLFLAGVIAAATMIVPGVSGSFVLLLLGMYNTFLAAVNDLNIAILAVLSIGAAVGIVLVSKLINLLLARAHAATYWAIIGLVAGSIATIWIESGVGIPDLASIVALVVGATAAMLLGGRAPQTSNSSSTPE